MKKCIILIVLLIFVLIKSLTFAQEELVPNYLFLFGQINVQSTTTITHTLTAIGAYWELDNGDLPISDNSDLAEASAIITGSTTTEPSFLDPGEWYGFLFPWTPNPYQYTDEIAYGFYKVTNSYNNDYFYIDIRD